MSSETAISVNHLSKCYQVYDKPHDRLKQSKSSTKARLRGLTVHDSRNQGTLVKPKVAK